MPTRDEALTPDELTAALEVVLAAVPAFDVDRTSEAASLLRAHLKLYGEGPSRSMVRATLLALDITEGQADKAMAILDPWLVVEDG